MDRREFLITGSGATIASLVPKTNSLFPLAAISAGWRAFEVVTHIEILKPLGATRVWAPAALIREAPYQRTLANHFLADGGTAQLVESQADGLGIVTAEFPTGVRPVVMVTNRIEARDYAVDFSKASQEESPNRVELEHFLRPAKLMPTDGIVKQTATEITAGAKSDLEKARAIYEWIVENTFRNPKTRGCGTGDIRFMLETRDLGGKCADLNALYVGLARAAGLPARDVYGIRLGKSELGYKSLGPLTENVTKAQHCRAEVYLREYGWVPVDPADVRKVVLEEPPGNRSLDDEMVKKARARLFGSWEMNWMAYNYAHDVRLPGTKSGSLGFLMYPQAETDAGLLDCLDPDNFRYEISAREVSLG
jgi:transglutaminase-like putative cysteine protease